MDIDFGELEKKIEKFGEIKVLDNGLVLVSENTPGTGLVLGSVEIVHGRGIEQPQDYGAMHFLEHLLFGESQKQSNRRERFFESGLLGLEVNAGTSFENIIFPVQGSNSSRYLLESNFVKSLDLVCDMIFFPQINYSSLNRERAIVLREIEESEFKNSLNLLHKELKKVNEKIYSNNLSLLTNNLGTVETVTNLSMDTIKKYHSDFFVSNNVFVRLQGDLNGVSSVKNNVIASLEKLPVGFSKEKIEVVEEKPFEGTEFLTFDSLKQDYSSVDIFYQTPPSHSAKNPALQLFSYILCSMPVGVFYEQLRDEKGFSYSLGYSLEGHSKTGILKLSYDVHSNNIEESLALFDECVDKVKRGDFDDRLIDTFKNSMLPGVLHNMQQPGWVANELKDRYNKNNSRQETTGLEQLKILLDLTKEDIVDFANTYFNKDRLIVLYK